MHHILLHFYGLTLTGWKIVGYLGVAFFASRWFFQIYASKKAGRPVMTRWFWVLSLFGSAFLLIYFIYGIDDSVGLLSNLFPGVIASYNLFLDIRYKKRVQNERLI